MDEFDRILAEMNALLEQVLENIPNTPFSTGSRDYFHEDAPAWIATKSRAMYTAIKNWDTIQIEQLKDDIALVTGRVRAEEWYLEVMQRIVTETNHAD